ncbi:hypothetical protein Tco_1338722 [Tanacetum coccineum]
MIALVKVRWDSKRGLELTWERGDTVTTMTGAGYVRFDNQSIERDRLIGIGFVLNFVKFISFTFGDKEMISVIEAIICEVFVKLLLKSSGKLSISERDRLIIVDRGTRSVPLFVMLSVTVSTWFGVFALIGFKGEPNGAKIERSG